MNRELRPIKFLRGVPDPSLFPLESIRECVRELLDGLHAAGLQYGPAAGPELLRTWIAERHGYDVDRVITADGSLTLFGLLLDVVAKPGDAVAVEAPTYDRIPVLLKRRGLRPIAVDLRRNGSLDLSALEDAVARDGARLIYLIPDFQNPSGTCLPLGDREQIVRTARQYGALVVEDAPYRALRYRGETLPAMHEIGPDCTLLLGSLSKLLVPGLRAGYAAGPMPLIQRMIQRAEESYVCPGVFALSIAGLWCKRGYLDSHIEQLRAEYRSKLDRFSAELTARCGALHWSEPLGGFFVGAYLPRGVRASALRNAALNERLHIGDASGCFLDGRGERFIRLPFCALDAGEIVEGVSRLAKALESVTAMPEAGEILPG